MSSLVAEVVAQLATAIRQLDTLAVTAAHAQEEIDQGHSRYVEASQGTEQPDSRAAVTHCRTAADRAGRLGRLTSNAAGHLATYANVIAPGSVPVRADAGDASPSGERLVGESEGRGSRAEAFLRRHVKKADETEGNLQNAEQAATTAFREFVRDVKGGPGGTSTSTTQPKPAAPADRPQLEHPVTSVIMAAGAVVVGVKGLWNMTKKHRERKRRDDQS
ncbi:hypothetical protein [Verrucosispora sp. WMMD573]|uniref:hypothetical protein n=1 Tax=Verrucosispora sp. WMMD573 TaxID=3015149 RepID=UPI00248CBA1D|nr:hypothetical protein [Verrucosispora sp. WMMD573]WBB54418.1 hypothetical protein O7601_28545 [Verrucosispora sp. WMMD573]